MAEKPILLRQYVPLEAYKPRAYLNGFPKSGLHMLEQMAGILLTPSSVGTGGSPWLGTHKWHSWSMIWQDLRRYLWRMSCIERGTYLMGHSGYEVRIARLMSYANIGHVFLYRDLRDVAVSQAHHILDEDQSGWQHAHKDLYKMLGSFDAALLAVIEGLGPYPGVVARWEEYAPWLENEDALILTYEEMRGETQKTAARLVLYLLRKATDLLEDNKFGVDMSAEDVERLSAQMAEACGEPSGTFRRGVAGGWRDEFKAEHVAAFKRSDPDGWLRRLGYETSEDW